MAKLKADEIVSELITQLEKGKVKEFEFPWCGHIGRPKCASTKAYYNGGNAIWLSFKRHIMNYSCNLWGTMNQWNKIGGKVKKGETAGTQQIIKPMFQTIEDEHGKEQQIITQFYAYYVYNIDQVDGVKREEEKPAQKIDEIKEADKYIASSKINIKYSDQPRASYSPDEDYCHLPFKDTFKHTHGFYSTLFHEVVHATGHKSRLDRKGITETFKRDEDYALEELIAELGAALLCSKFDMYMHKREDHLSYLDSWIKILKEKPTILWTASKQAQESIDWLDFFSTKYIKENT